MLKENFLGIKEINEKMKLLECKNKTLKTQIEEEKTKNSKLKTLIIAKEFWIRNCLSLKKTKTKW